MQKELKEKVDELLKSELEKYYSKSDGGNYVCELYDFFHDYTFEEYDLINNAIKNYKTYYNDGNSLVEHFKMELSDFWFEQAINYFDGQNDYNYNCAKDYIIDKLCDLGLLEKYSELEDKVDDYMRDEWNDYVVWDLSYNDVLYQNIKVDLFIDTGDGNYDYSINNITEPDDISEESSIYWLLNKQGYSVEKYKEYLDSETEDKNIFLDSLGEELYNLTYSGKLAFAINCDIEEYLNIVQKIIDNKINNKPCDIKIGKKVNCGYVNTWNGSGSMLEIQLEKDIEIEVQYIEEIIPDKLVSGYGINEIYGLCDDFWNGKILA